MRVLVAGATGALGRHLVPMLRANAHEVFAVTRTSEAEARARSLGAHPLMANVLERDSLREATRGRRFDAVIHELTSLRKPPLRHRDMQQTNRLRIEGTRNLIEVAGDTGATRFVTQSIVFGYGFRDHGDTELTEANPFGQPQGDAFDPTLAALASTEQQVLRDHQDWLSGVALRYGLLYGGDVAVMAALLRKRSLPVVRNGGLIPFVHHADAAAATLAALEDGQSGAAYNIVDDTPATFADLANEIARSVPTPRPLVIPQRMMNVLAPYGRAIFALISMRASNKLARQALGWSPHYPSIREGVRASQERL